MASTIQWKSPWVHMKMNSTPSLHLPASSLFFFFTLGFHNIFNLFWNNLLTSFTSLISLPSDPFITLLLIYSFSYLKPVNRSPTCRVAFRDLQDLALTYLSRFICHHFSPITSCFNKTELLTVPKIYQGVLTILCIYPGCYVSTTPPVNQSFPLLFPYFSIRTVKTFTQPTFTENLYVPQKVLNTGNPAGNYPDGIYNPSLSWWNL